MITKKKCFTVHLSNTEYTKLEREARLKGITSSSFIHEVLMDALGLPKRRSYKKVWYADVPQQYREQVRGFYKKLQARYPGYTKEELRHEALTEGLRLARIIKEEQE